MSSRDWMCNQYSLKVVLCLHSVQAVLNYLSLPNTSTCLHKWFTLDRQGQWIYCIPNLINPVFKYLLHRTSLSVSFIYKLYHLYRKHLRKLCEIGKHNFKKDLRNLTLHKHFCFGINHLKLVVCICHSS